MTMGLARRLAALGTALATASAQLLSSGLCFVYIRKMRPFLAVHRADMRMDPVLIHRTSSYAAVAALLSNITVRSMIKTDRL